MSKRQTTDAVRQSEAPEAVTVSPAKRMVEALAYELWLERGCPVGSDQEDWYKAEEQLRTAQSLAA